MASKAGRHCEAEARISAIRRPPSSSVGWITSDHEFVLTAVISHRNLHKAFRPAGSPSRFRCLPHRNWRPRLYPRFCRSCSPYRRQFVRCASFSFLPSGSGCTCIKIPPCCLIWFYLRLIGVNICMYLWTIHSHSRAYNFVFFKSRLGIVFRFL